MNPRITYALLIASALLCACSAEVGETASTAMPSIGATSTATSIALSKPTAIQIADNLSILEPGPRSLLTSPLVVQALIPPETGLLRIELYKQSDDTLLNREVFAASDASPIHVALPFEVRQSEDAWLLLSRDDAFGRTVEVRSVAVTLLNNGQTTLQPHTDETPLAIRLPEAGQTIDGGQVTVSGLVSTDVLGALNVRLIARDGRVLAAGDSYPQDGEFVITLNYEVDEPENVLIVVAYPPNGVTLDLASAETLLAP